MTALKKPATFVRRVQPLGCPMKKRLLAVAILVVSLAACGGEEPASIGAIHHEVAAVSEAGGKLVVTVRARSAAVDQSYWLPHVAGVVRQVLAEAGQRWPDKLAHGAVFQTEASDNGAPVPALALAYTAPLATNWRKASDFAALEVATLDDVAPAGGRAIRAFCEEPNQARYGPTFCLRALAAGR